MVVIALANALVYLLAYVVIDVSQGNFMNADIVELIVTFLSLWFLLYWKVGQAKRYLREKDLDEMDLEDSMSVDASVDGAEIDPDVAQAMGL
jgi:hypothetical protein